jgi:hypothetical protein
LFYTLHGGGYRLLGSIGASGVSDHGNDTTSCIAADSAAVVWCLVISLNILAAHDDHRHRVFARRDEPHEVMAHHDGHLPDHAIAVHGARILCAYEVVGKRVWIITEADRSATTLHFPEDY